MNYRKGSLIFASALIALSSGAIAQDDQRVDAEAVEIATNAAKFLTGQKAMSFDWFVTHDVVVEGREKITYVSSGSNLMVRGKGVRSLTERGDGLREYYYDGETFTIAAPEKAFYASSTFDKGFEALIDAVSERTGTEIPVWTLMSASLGEGALERIEGAAYLGVTRLAGHEAHHLAFTEYEEDWQIWISTDPERPVPLMIVGTDPYQQGWPQYRAHMMNWNFDVTEEDGSFVYDAPEEDVRVTMPSLIKTYREELLEAAGAKSEQPKE